MRLSGVVCIVSFSFVGWGSCSPSLETACQHDLPNFEKEISVSLNQLERERGRVLASVNEKDAREDWLDWAETQLKRTQRLIDAADEFPELTESRKRLSDLANEFVYFHGYAERGDSKRMSETLLRATNGIRELASLQCK